MKKLFILFFVTFLNLMFVTCSAFSTTEELSISLKEISFKESIECVYISTDGKIVNEFYEGEETVITVFKNTPTPVLFRDEKYGIIYPYTLELDKASAFCADVFLTMYKASNSQKESSLLYLQQFNWAKLIECVSEYDDPWLLNKQKIMEAIADGTFTKRSITLL